MKDHLDTHKLIKYALEMKAKEKQGCKMVNVDKVVEQLEELREFHNDLSRSDKLSGVQRTTQSINAGCFAKAIDIVKAGGVE